MSTANAIRGGAAFIEIFIKDQVAVGLKKINKSLLGFSAKAGLAGAAIGAGGLAILRPLISAGSEFAEFDTSLRAISGASKLTADQMSELGEELKRVSVQRGIGLQELADETVELARALGELDTSQLVDLADIVSQLALSTKSTLNTARSGILTIIGSFGLDTSQARSVADLLVEGANTAQADLGDFVSELKTVGPAAKAAGTSLQTLIALSAALSGIGIKGEEAGTQLRRLSVDVVANTAELEKAFNIKIPKGASFARVLESLNQATKNDDVTTRLAKYNKAFGLLGITAALGLGATAEQFKKFQKEFIDSSGELQKQFDLIQGGVGGGFKRLSASFDVLRVTIGGALEDLFGKFADAIQSVNEVLSPFIKNNKEIAEVLVLVGIGAVATGAALLAMSVSAAISATAFTLLIAFLGAVTSPIGAIVLAIGVFAVELGLLGAAFLAFTKTGNALAKSLGQGMISAFKAIKKAVGEILKTVKLAMGGISLAIKNGDLQGAADIAFLGMKVAALQAFKSIVDAAGPVTKVFLDLISIVAESVITTITFVSVFLEELENRIGNISTLLGNMQKIGAFGLPGAIIANTLGGNPNPKQGPRPQSALEKALAESQKKLQELIDEQKKNLKIPDPKTGKKLDAPDDKGVGSGISDAIEKGAKGMVSSSFDSTRGLIKGQQNAASASLKSIAGSTKEMADILRNGTIKISPAEKDRILQGLNPEAEAAAAKRSKARKKGLETIGKSGVPISSVMEPDKAKQDAVKDVLRETFAKEAIKNEATNAKIKAILEKDAAKAAAKTDADAAAKDLDALKGLEYLLRAIKGASESQTKLLQKISEKEGAVFE